MSDTVVCTPDTAALGEPETAPGEPVRMAVPAREHAVDSRIVALDFLRGLAALSVAIPHFYMHASNGESVTWEVISVTGVEVFFVLSGFVLAQQLLYCVERGDLRTLRTFLVRRWMRT